ncbi:MAG: nicotinate-nucleotide adenylyltransferase [Pseudomonadales bacterium]
MSKAKTTNYTQTNSKQQLEHKAAGVFGGSFDPVHFGHLRAALELALTFGLESVRLVPNHQPPHRDSANVSAGHRIEMLKLALQQCDQLQLDTREMDRDGPSYTFDTLRSMREEFGNNTPIIFGMGADAFEKIASWYRADELLDVASIAVLSRPGSDVNAITGQELPFSAHWVSDADALLGAPCGLLYKLEMTPLAISSTRIREQIARGWASDFLLPETVCSYIERHELYRA